MSVKSKDRVVMMVGTFLVMISLGGAFAFGDFTPEKEKPGIITITALLNETLELGGTVNEGDSATNEVTIDKEKIIKVIFTLTFEDEPDADARHSNQPDTLALAVSNELAGEGSDEATGQSGTITLEFSTTEEAPWDLRGTAWNVTVEAVNCGDQEPLVPSLFGFRTINDGSNDWDLSIEYQYLVEIELITEPMA